MTSVDIAAGVAAAVARLALGVDPAQDAALAAGQVLHPLVAQWQAQAQVLRLPHAGGHMVLHHWPAAAATTGRSGAHKAPVLLLHGGSGSWTHWAANLAALTQAGHAVWALDLPGFGASDPLPHQQDVDTMLPLLAQALQHCGQGQALQVMGFSLGGMTAALLAAHSPALVRQIIMVGAPGLGLRDKPIYRLQGWRHIDDVSEQLRRHTFNLAALMLADPGLIDRATLALHTANVHRDRLPRRRLSSTDVLRQTLPRLACPVHAIYGEQDVIYRGLWPAAHTCLAQAARQFQGLHLLPGAGHWVQYEQPQAFAQVALPLLY